MHKHLLAAVKHIWPFLSLSLSQDVMFLAKWWNGQKRQNLVRHSQHQQSTFDCSSVSSCTSWWFETILAQSCNIWQLLLIEWPVFSLKWSQFYKMRKSWHKNVQALMSGSHSCLGNSFKLDKTSEIRCSNVDQLTMPACQACLSSFVCLPRLTFFIRIKYWVEGISCSIKSIGIFIYIETTKHRWNEHK